MSFADIKVLVYLVIYSTSPRLKMPLVMGFPDALGMEMRPERAILRCSLVF